MMTFKPNTTVGIDAGKLQHRVTFQRDTGTPDAIGGNAPTWATVFSVWANIEPLTGRDIILGYQISPDTTHKVTIRYRPGLHSAMRFTWAGRVFHLTGPPLDMGTDGVLLTLMCKEAETVT